MTRMVHYALLPALLSCAAEAQIGDRCNLTPDMDYLAVELWERVGLESRTYVAGPDYSSDRTLVPIDPDHASLQAGKEWLRLPDETPAYCQATVRTESRPTATITDCHHRSESVLIPPV